MDDVTLVDAGYIYSAVLRVGGEAWGWGSNNNSSLGIGYEGTYEFDPVPALGPPGGFSTLSAGEEHTLALVP